jgi:Ca2+-binding RTX toxin-like protein
VLSTVGGVAITTGYQNINFSNTEAVNVIDVLDSTPVLARVAMGDLFVRGTTGDDIIQFGATITPNVASTRVNAGIYNLAVSNKTVVFGRDGADTIQQSSLAKTAEFYGGPGDDYLSGAAVADYLVGGLGVDRLLGNNGANELWGDDLGDASLATGGNDIISGGTGADRIYGGGGNDSITVGAGNDYVFGGTGNDTIDGGADDDRLYGGDGDDVISGNTGDDLLAGNGGNDRLYGQAGKDVLIGGLGADYMTGDDNSDLLFDGIVTATDANNNLGSDASLLVNDANDLAMAQLLADWKAGNFAHLASHPHDADSDTLTGGLGGDTSSKGANDTSDAETAF